MPATTRSRRSCLAVPGSSTRRLETAQGLPADEVDLDLEDPVAPLAKEMLPTMSPAPHVRWLDVPTQADYDHASFEASRD